MRGFFTRKGGPEVVDMIKEPEEADKMDLKSVMILSELTADDPFKALEVAFSLNLTNSITSTFQFCSVSVPMQSVN